MAEVDDIADSTEAPASAVGSRLRAAREEQGLSVEDIAVRTRIPTRHIENIETGQWARLPTQTYSIGFAKSYATALGLDRNEIADQLRSEIGSYTRASASPEFYEAADPKRVPPRSLLLISVLAIVIVVGLLMWLKNRSLSDEAAPPPEVAATATPDGNAAVPATSPAPAAPAPAPAAGPVVLTANQPVWIKVSDGTASLFQGTLNAGQKYEVPASATAPKLTTGRPEALRISVGTATAPPVGEPGSTVSGVSLRAADLARGPSANPAAPAQ